MAPAFQASLELAMSAAPLGTWEWDPRSERLLWSPSCCQMWGIAVDEPLRGWSRLAELLHPEDRGRVLATVQGAVAGGPPQEVEFRHWLPDGELRWGHLHCRALAGTEEGSVLVVGIHLDISERKRQEAERQELDRRLLHSQKFQSLGVLAGGIAHDFNNLLATVLLRTELTRAALGEHPAAEHLQAIDESARRAAELCRQMLAYAGRGRVSRRRLDLAREVRAAVELAQASASKKIEFVLELGDEPTWVEADAGQLQQVALNLVLNSVEALGENAGRVRLAVGRAELSAERLARLLPYSERARAPGWYACLAVTDDGPGMSREVRERMFEPFFSTRFAGRGLGLATVLGIVDAHRGAIEVDSLPGSGTALRVWLPQTGPHERGETSPAAAAARSRLRGRILLADDEPELRRAGRMVLEHFGLTVSTAADGREALAACATAAFDVVLLDLSMPGLDGVEVSRELRRRGYPARIVVTSGFTESELQARLTGVAVDGLIQKPFSIGELRATLAEMLSS